MEKKLSVIVPMYNCEKYIGLCLDSLVEQGMGQDEYEVIVVNDGSTDGGLAIAEDYAARHSQVRVLTQKNAGQSAARNRGISEATGRYIAFVDGDDFVARNAYGRLCDIAAERNLQILTFGLESRWETTPPIC